MLKRIYYIEIAGNDNFYYTDTTPAINFAAALTAANQLLTKLQHRTIEQIRIVHISESN